MRNRGAFKISLSNPMSGGESMGGRRREKQLF